MILVLNGSPRKNGTVAKRLRAELKRYDGETVIWEDVCDLHFSFCKGCMACRSKENCVLPEDDAHRIAQEIKDCDMIFVGTPMYWGNMNRTLKSLFDRLVGVLMGESRLGIPIPLHKGKKAVVVTACTTPFPFNYVCGQSNGAFRAVKEILKSSGFRIVRNVNISNTKKRGGTAI